MQDDSMGRARSRGRSRGRARADGGQGTPTQGRGRSETGGATPKMTRGKSEAAASLGQRWSSADIAELNDPGRRRRGAAPESGLVRRFLSAHGDERRQGFYVHPSHAGTNWQRKPRKRTKKVTRTAVHDPLAPVFVAQGDAGVQLDVALDYRDAGQPGFGHYGDGVAPGDRGSRSGAFGGGPFGEDGEYGAYGADGQAGDMSERDVPFERQGSRRPVGSLDGTHSWAEGESGAAGVGRRRAKSRKAERTTSDESAAALHRRPLKALLDYNKLAQADELDTNLMKHAADASADQWRLREPDEQDDDPNLVKGLSYRQVQVHADEMHPRDRRESRRRHKPGDASVKMAGDYRLLRRWDWCEADIGYIPFWCDPLHAKEEWVTPCAREIGLGPTLFLMTLKAFMWLFLFFSVIHLPLFMLYASGDQSGSTGESAAADEPVDESQQSFNPTSVFGWLSLGNLGVSGYTCANFNVGKHQKTLRFSCPYGTLRQLTSYGVQGSDGASCTVGESGLFYIGERPPDRQYDKVYDLQYDCTMENGMTTEGYSNLTATFDSVCYESPDCDLEVMYSWFGWDCRNRINYYAAASEYDDYAVDMGWEYHLWDPRIREPQIFGVALCVADKMYSPFTGEEMNMDKAGLAYVLLVYDLVIILVSVMFINLLYNRYHQYAAMYDKRSVEMRDFSVRVCNLPNDWAFGGKDALLQCALWNHIERCLADAMLAQAGRGDGEAALQAREDRAWEICDVNFADVAMRETDLLIKMDGFDREKKVLIHKATKKAAADPDVDLAQDNQAIIDLILKYKEAKADYINMQEKKLYNKWEITPENENTVDDLTLPIAFVVFKSMRGKQKCVELFSEAEANAAKSSRFKELRFLGNWLDVKETCSPNTLIWHHLRYGTCNRVTRCVLVWILALCICMLAFVAMVAFKNYNDELMAGASPNMKCPRAIVTADLALEDFDKIPKQRQGFGPCFCLKQYNDNGGSVAGALAAFKEERPDQTENPCDEWKERYEKSFYMLIISGAMIGIINAICVAVFENIVVFEKLSTLEAETTAQFQRIVIIQFLNIAVVLLFADFTTGYTEEEMGVPVLVGRYRDFDTDWFYSVGVQISVAMVSNSIAPYAGKLFEPVIQSVLRWVDRGCKTHLLKKRNIEKEQAEREAEEAKSKTKKGGGAEEPQEEEEEEEEEEEDEEAEGGAEEEPQRRRKRNKKLDDVFNPNAAEGGDDLEEPVDSAGEAEGEGTVTKEPGAKKTDGEAGEELVGEDEPETGGIFQDDLNELYLGKLVQVFYIYSWFFTNLLVYYMYSGAMPIMYPLGCLHFFLGYLAYKFLFLRHHQKTYGFDEHVPFLSVSLMKFALLFHLLMNLFWYTNQRLLTPQGYGPPEHYRPVREPAGDFFGRRWSTPQTQAVLVFFLVMVGLYLLYYCVVVPIIKCARGGRRQASDEEMADREDHSDDIYREMSIKSLKSHYVRAHKEWEVFRTMINAVSYDRSKLSDEDAHRFKKQLKMRIQNIEERIDLHLDHIGGLEPNMHRTYMYKLAVLLANEDKVKMRDPCAGRMVDTQQSYWIYDSTTYAKPGVIQSRLDREILELDFLGKEKPVYC